MKRLLLTLTGILLLMACEQSLVSRSTQVHALEAVQAGALLVDVRTEEEVSEGTLAGAVNIPHEQILEGLRALDVPKERPVVVFCRSGNRSEVAAEALEDAGFLNVTNAGGYEDLRAIKMAMQARDAAEPKAATATGNEESN